MGKFGLISCDSINGINLDLTSFCLRVPVFSSLSSSWESANSIKKSLSNNLKILCLFVLLLGCKDNYTKI